MLSEQHHVERFVITSPAKSASTHTSSSLLLESQNCPWNSLQVPGDSEKFTHVVLVRISQILCHACGCAPGCRHGLHQDTTNVSFQTSISSWLGQQVSTYDRQVCGSVHAWSRCTFDFCRSAPALSREPPHVSDTVRASVPPLTICVPRQLPQHLPVQCGKTAREMSKCAISLGHVTPCLE